MMNTAFEIGRIQSRITEAYKFLCECAGEGAVMRVPVLVLVEPSPSVATELVHNPRRRYKAQILRDFFSQPQSVSILPLLGMAKPVLAHEGQQAATILGHAQQAILTSTVETEDGHVEYGVDKLGPYRFTIFKKRRFLRKKEPSLERVSFEELCLHTEQPHDAVAAVFQLLDTTVTSLLPSKR